MGFVVLVWLAALVGWVGAGRHPVGRVCACVVAYLTGAWFVHELTNIQIHLHI